MDACRRHGPSRLSQGRNRRRKCIQLLLESSVYNVLGVIGITFKRKRNKSSMMRRQSNSVEASGALPEQNGETHSLTRAHGLGVQGVEEEASDACEAHSLLIAQQALGRPGDRGTGGFRTRTARM